MKKIITIALAFVISMAVAGSVSASTLPTSTWQTYKGGILTVYRGADAKSGIYYQGAPSGYDGKATYNNYNIWRQGWALPPVTK